MEDFYSQRLQLHGDNLQPRSVSWSPPLPIILKVNTDAAFDQDHRKVKLGAVVRNHLGNVLVSSSMKVMAESSLLAEMMAIKRGL